MCLVPPNHPLKNGESGDEVGDSKVVAVMHEGMSLTFRKKKKAEWSWALGRWRETELHD